MRTGADRDAGGEKGKPNGKKAVSQIFAKTNPTGET
jgi:hypothetical protein